MHIVLKCLKIRHNEKGHIVGGQVPSTVLVNEYIKVIPSLTSKDD